MERRPQNGGVEAIAVRSGGPGGHGHRPRGAHARIPQRREHRREITYGEIDVTVGDHDPLPERTVLENPGKLIGLPICRSSAGDAHLGVEPGRAKLPGYRSSDRRRPVALVAHGKADGQHRIVIDGRGAQRRRQPRLVAGARADEDHAVRVERGRGSS